MIIEPMNSINLETGRIEVVKPQYDSFYLENFSKDDEVCEKNKNTYKDSEKNIKNDLTCKIKISGILTSTLIARRIWQIRDKAYKFVKDKLNEFNEDKENKLNMSFMEYIKYKILRLFGWMSYKYRLIKKAEEKFVEELPFGEGDGLV